LPLRRTWPLCEPVCPVAGEAMVVSVAAWAACGRTARGARAMRVPRPIATYLLIIAVPLEGSLPTLVSRTISICAFHAELEMNVDLAALRPQTAPILGPCAQPTVAGQSPVTRRSNTRASALSSTFLRVAAGLPRWLPAALPALCLPRSPRLSLDAGQSPSRVAALVFGAHATPRGLPESGTIRSPLPPERTAEERDEQIHRPSERRLRAPHPGRRGRDRCGVADQLQSGG